MSTPIRTLVTALVKTWQYGDNMYRHRIPEKCTQELIDKIIEFCEKEMKK